MKQSEHIITPKSELYVQSYAFPPSINVEDWRLEFTGAIAQPSPEDKQILGSTSWLNLSSLQFAHPEVISRLRVDFQACLVLHVLWSSV